MSALSIFSLLALIGFVLLAISWLLRRRQKARVEDLRMLNADKVFSLAPHDGPYMVAGYCRGCLVDYSALIKEGRDGEVRKLISDMECDL